MKIWVSKLFEDILPISFDRNSVFSSKVKLKVIRDFICSSFCLQSNYQLERIYRTKSNFELLKFRISKFLILITELKNIS